MQDDRQPERQEPRDDGAYEAPALEVLGRVEALTGLDDGSLREA
jgi:hypothetical protein